MHFLFTFLYNHDCKYTEPCKVIFNLFSFVNNSLLPFAVSLALSLRFILRSKFSINHLLKDAYWVHRNMLIIDIYLLTHFTYTT